MKFFEKPWRKPGLFLCLESGGLVELSGLVTGCSAKQGVMHLQELVIGRRGSLGGNAPRPFLEGQLLGGHDDGAHSFTRGWTGPWSRREPAATSSFGRSDSKTL